MIRRAFRLQGKGLRWVLRAAALLLLAGCGQGHETDCLKSTGRVVTERRALPAFTQVYAYDNVDVQLVQDTATYAEVRTGKNLQEDIELTSSGSQLVIHNTSRCNWVRRYDTPRIVTLHTPYVRDLFLRGQGNLSTAGNFRADTLFFHLLGAGDATLDVTTQYMNMDMYELGDVTLRGRITDLLSVVGGSGSLDAASLQNRRTYVRLDRFSNGDARFAPTEELRGTHAGAGTLYYHGQPTRVNVEVTGPGELTINN